MLLVPTAVEHTDVRSSTRSTPVVWVWLALVVAMFVLSRLVAFDHDQRLGLLSPMWFAGVTFVEASWSLYADPELFDVWQVWSHLVVHPVWWHLPIEVAVMLVIGRALERTVGSLLFAAALACLGPLGGIALALVGGESPYAGGLPLSLAVLGLALGRWSGAQTRWSVVWWAVVAVGHWPLFRLPLPSVLVLLLVPVMVGAPRGYALIHLVIVLLVAGAGAALGVLMRRAPMAREPAA
jgi:membrane associated rhomboid family serine protease